MRYYFFKNISKIENGKPRMRLMPLSGQTFPDGTPVREDYHVQAPKEPGTSANGCRLEYPEGTIFGSTHLELRNEDGRTPFYTVYDENAKDKDPDFHPINTGNGFRYASPSHESSRMNAAYCLFVDFDKWQGGDETDTEEPAREPVKKPAVSGPTDKNGKARPKDTGWSERYPGQIDTETNLLAVWMIRILKESGVNMAVVGRRPAADNLTKPRMETLYACGESLDTIASRTRYESVYKKAGMDQQGLRSIANGPMAWYLGELVREHETGAECTATDRDPDNAQEMADLSLIVTQEINRQTAGSESPDDATVIGNLTEAVRKGWTLDEILEPGTLLQKDSAKELATALATGIIPAPEKGKSGKSYIETLMAKAVNNRPKDKDGFHVDEKIWRQLVLHLNRGWNAMLTGPTGSGKTEIVRRLCEQTGTPFTLIPMGSITDPTEQLIGKMDFKDNPNSPKQETVFDWADFALAIQRPGVVLLDEINRIPRNGWDILFSVLDGSKELTASGAKSTDKRIIKVHPECVFFATANIGDGYQTQPLDKALMNRFTIIELGYMDHKTEAVILSARTGISKDDAKNIALVAKNIRDKYQEGTELQTCVSTRHTLRCAEYVRDGYDVEEAMELIFLPEFDAGRGPKDITSERAVVRSMIASRFNSAAKAA